MKIFVTVIVSLVAGFLLGLMFKDRVFGIGLPYPILRLNSPVADSPYYQIKLASLNAAEEGYIFLIEENSKSEYLVFPKVGDNGVLKVEVRRK